jgi:hypothetical protein
MKKEIVVMQTTPATPELVMQWKRTYADYRDRLRPNRKTGRELLAGLKARYPLRELSGEVAKKVVSDSVTSNEALRKQLPEGMLPEPACFIVKRVGAGMALYDKQDDCYGGMDIFVGIDLASGWFCVEGSSLLWDEMYAFRGLNEQDLQNYYSVAEYIACLKRFDRLDSVLER